MAKFKKIILKPGSYVSPDGEMNIDENRIKHWVKQFNRMKSSGLNIPTPWGHQDQPTSIAEKELWESKFNAGFVDNLEVDENGNLTTIVDVPRQEDAERVGTIVKEVSPQIESVWRDGKGKIWSDVITHLAFVTHPVVSGQSNFERIEDTPLKKYAMRLSLSNYKENKDMPEPIDMDMAGTKRTPSTRASSARASSPRASSPRASSPRAEVTAERTGSGRSPEILDILASIGLVLPEDIEVPDGPFADALEAAALTLKHKIDELDEETGPEGAGGEFKDLELPPELLEGLEKGPQEEEGTEMKDAGTKGKPLDEQPAQMTMSLSKELDKTKQRLSLAERKWEESDKKGMDKDIKELVQTGRVTPAIANKLREKVRIYKLSLTNEGEPLTSVLQSEIDMFKLMPESMVLSDDQKFRMRNITEEILPSEFKEVAIEDAERIADDQLKRSGRGLALN